MECGGKFGIAARSRIMPFIATAIVYPQVGKLGDVRAALEERVRMVQSKGLRADLAITAFGDDPALFANILFPDLESADAYRDGPLAPQADPAFATKMAGLTRQPPRNQLREALLPQNSAAVATPIRYNLIATLMPQPAA